MNHSMIRSTVGRVLKMEGLLMIFPMLVGVMYREKSAVAFLITMILCLVFGTVLSWKINMNREFYALEGYITVALSWISLSIFGAIPFVISGEIPSVINAVFETVSGFTTTGASILEDVESLSKCMLLWRSFTHWIGGMGVLVCGLAVLPAHGGASIYLMKAESTGPSIEKIVPRLRNTAAILYGIYTLITIITIISLCLAGMPLFEAATTGFGTVGTGGFGTKNSSLTDYSPAIQRIVTVFMILCGVNFNIYYLALCKKWKQILKSEEFKAYLGIILVSVIIIAICIRGHYGTWEESIRHSAFQVGSIITTTGFSTTDYDLWPQLPKTILVILMFIGASAGSTGGGMKVSRFIIMMKTVKKEIFTFVHPHGIKKIKMDGRVVEHEVVRAVNIYLIAYILIFVASCLLVSIDNYDMTTNFTAVAATFNNIGPGLELVGPTQNFNLFSGFSKIVLSFDMLAGRLEVFPMLVLFSPYVWKRNRF